MCINGSNESTLVTDSSVLLMNYDPSDLRSPILIQITPKERTLNQHKNHGSSNSPDMPPKRIICRVGLLQFTDSNSIIFKYFCKTVNRRVNKVAVIVDPQNVIWAGRYVPFVFFLNCATTSLLFLSYSANEQLN